MGAWDSYLRAFILAFKIAWGYVQRKFTADKTVKQRANLELEALSQTSTESESPVWVSILDSSMRSLNIKQKQNIIVSYSSLLEFQIFTVYSADIHDSKNKSIVKIIESR